MAQGVEPAKDANPPRAAPTITSSAAWRGLLTGVTAIPKPIARPNPMLAEAPPNILTMMEGTMIVTKSLSVIGRVPGWGRLKITMVSLPLHRFVDGRSTGPPRQDVMKSSA